MNRSVARKIVAAETLARTLQEVRAAGLRVVQCHGCFDLLHPGHLRYLQAARTHGEVLVVSLTADEGIQKGPDRPYIPQDLRAESLAALEFVDWVVIDPAPTAEALLRLLQPDVYLKGYEYARGDDPRFGRERAAVESYGGRVVFHSDEVVYSSTRLLESLAQDQQLEQMRLRTLLMRRQVTLPGLLELLARMRGLRVVVVGDALRERTVYCEARQTAVDAPVLAAQELERGEAWGGAAALAQQLAALGAAVELITATCADADEPLLTRAMSEAGVRLCGLRQRPERPSRTVFRVGDAKVLEVNHGRVCPLDSAAEKEALGALRTALADADVLLLHDLGLGLLTPGLIRSAIQAGRRAGCYLAGAAHGLRGDAAALTDLDLLTGGERQIRDAAHDLNSSLPAVVWNLLHQTRCSAALVALPRRGLMAFDGSDSAANRLRTEYIPALTAHAVDGLGAEEALLATAALARAAGAVPTLAAYLAALAEAVVVSGAGRTFAAPPQIEQFARQRPDLLGASGFVPLPSAELRLAPHRPALERPAAPPPVTRTVTPAPDGSAGARCRPLPAESGVGRAAPAAEGFA